MEDALRCLRTPETVAAEERDHSGATDRNYRTDSSRSTTESAKNKGVRETKKFALHVDTDRLDHNEF
jgi:hypothetical protein